MTVRENVFPMPRRGGAAASIRALACAAIFCAAAAAVAEEPVPHRRISVPPDIGEDGLAARAKAQLETVDQLEANAFFRFEDRREASGITFLHRIVDDAGRDYKMVHYDHGNGVAVADVDGDGRLDVYLLTQVGANQLWRNRGGGKFEDTTEAAGVGVAERISVTASFADIDNDGDPDLFVTTVKMGNLLFENDGKGRFRDITEAAGVAYTGHSSGAVFFDYDNDGRLDLFLSNVGVYTTAEQGREGYYVGVQNAFSGHLYPKSTETSILYRNLGGNRFQDVSEATGLLDTTWSGDASPVDVDDDGWTDLYVLNMQGDDQLWVNLEGKKFERRTEQYFPKTPWGSMGVKFFDYDNDGRQDLILTDMHSDMSENVGVEREKLKSRMQWGEPQLQGGENNIFGNAFYRNLGDGKFEEVSDQAGAENYWPWGLSTGDLNADGWEDVFITASMNYPFRYGVNTLLLNNLGKGFVDAEFILGAEPRQGSLTQDWFELDCVGADKEHTYCEGEKGRLTVLGTLGTRSSVIFDIEGDGDLDILTNDFHSEPLVLISDLAEQHPVHWLEVDLTGTRSNRDGLGARVVVVAGDKRWTKVHDGQSGYLSQSSMPLYFGLGDAKKVDRIEVHWPSGTEQTVTEGLETNRRITITEPAGANE